MFEVPQVTADDAVACADGLRASVFQSRRLAAEKLAWVARWADVHAPVEDDPARDPGVAVGGHGTPSVAQFGVLELGMLLEVSPATARTLLADTLDLRHRLPRWWHAVMTGRVADYQAREVARATRRAGLTLDQSRWVDAETIDAARLPWGRVMAVVEAKIIAADPASHEERLADEASRQYVATSRRDTTTGLRTFIARTHAPAIIRFQAMVDHLAGLLAAAGDTSPAQIRRAKAFALLADPARACLLLAGRDEASAAHDLPTAPALDEVDPETGGVVPGPEPEPACATVIDAAAEVGRLLGALGEKALERLRPATVLYLHLAEEAVRGHCTRCAGEAAAGGEPCVDEGCVDEGCGHDTYACPDVSVPDAAAVARAERHGPLALDQLKRWLGTDRVVVRPVLDPLGQTPIDGYEVPRRMREAVQILHPFEVFPYGTLESRGADLDHTRPYLPRADGGPPGQTRTDNLGPLGRSRHRAKTFGRFRCYQPLPGLFLWRSPTGHWFRVDHTGTTPLGRQTPALVTQQRQGATFRLETAFRDLLLTGPLAAA